MKKKETKMRLLIQLVLVSILSLASLAMAASSKNKDEPLDQQVKNATHEISLLKESQAEIRRDELNYKIEKDLLKESYSTSLESVDKALTFILGLLAILGFLGIRDIGAMKKEYAEHLEKLGTLRNQLELDIQKINSEQADVREELTNILTTNKQQDNKFRVLELQEQVAKIMQNRLWSRALEYIAIGLELAPNDYLLKGQKGLCLIKLKNFTESVSIFRTLLEQDPNNPDSLSTLSNLAEGLLLSKNIEEFEKLRTTYSAQLAGLYEGSLLVYFDSLKACLQSDANGVRTALKSFAKTDSPIQQKNWIQNWDFTDVNQTLSEIQDEEAKRCFSLGVQFFSGSINVNQLLEQLG